MRPKQALGLLKRAANSWVNDYAPSMGAALSYYTLFSVAPLLLIVIAIAGMIFGDAAARGEIFTQLQGLMGAEGAKAIEGMLQAADKPKEGAVSSLIGVVVLLIGATTVFGELQNALDRIWRAPAREKSSGWWTLLRTRLLSFGMILGIAFLLMVSLILSAAISALGKLFSFEGWEALAHLLEIVISFGLTTVLFALIYKFIPHPHRLARRLWVYYSAQIFLLGAEFTRVYAHEIGSRRGQPRPGAEDVEAGEPPVPAPNLLPRAGALKRAVPPNALRVRKQHPLAFLVGALAFGTALGFLSRRRRFLAVLSP